MNRLTRTAEKYKTVLPRLHCPLCYSPLQVEGNGLICANRHTFNLSKKGYCDFASSNASSVYQKPLWDARREVFRQGFFTPLSECLLSVLAAEPPAFSVDAGCGEGSLTNRISAAGGGWLGLDLSRSGIALAEQEPTGCCWAVADLTRMPVKDGTVDCLINCLSPARYDEFARVLRPGGRLIKVLPDREHLRELRRLWKNDGGGEETVFPEHPLLETTERHTVQSTVRLCRYIRDVARMTPLGWHHQDKLPMEPMDITLSVLVVVSERL